MKPNIIEPMPSPSNAAPQKTLTLDTPVQYLKGIGPRRAAQLAKEGIRTIADLVEYPPFRYEDRSEFRTIRSLREGEWVLIRGRIHGIRDYRTHRRGFSILEMLLGDRTGGIMIKFFNQPYLTRLYRSGIDIIAYGQVRSDEFSRGALCLLNPECEILGEDSSDSVHTGRIVPIYRKLGEMRTRTVRQIMYGLVARLPPDMIDPIPAYLRTELRLLARHQALAQIHFPQLHSSAPAARVKEMEVLNQGISPAHKRMMFEELFQLQVGIRMVREHRMRIQKDRRLRLGDNVREAIKKILPFHPTSAQKRVLKEIAQDLCSPRPMSRLLQGDVGSGKTIVAAEAAIIAVENGYQVAVMAPTEILAEQHYFNFRRLFAPIDYRIDLLKGSLRAKQKRETLARIQSGESRVAIGTHALIQRGVQFHNLALVIIDEQHRFGVMQRSTLKEKGEQPDMLVMTATPIPRSLALTLYGDLDVSVIDEMPPGRKPIETSWLQEKDRKRSYEEMRRTVSAGHQVYVVYPLVEESERSDLRAATEMAERLQNKIFQDLKIGLLHGRMKSSEKDRVMSAFWAGELQVLVSTTVIEVGVDVANATLMVVEHAERFGLAQLHQLRGRVGRGADQSRCILITNVHGNPEAQRRMEIMCETNDGFRIAEVDLELRGPGEMIGTRQSGMPVFKFANLVRDRRALERARVEADRLIREFQRHPDMENRQILGLIRQRWKDRYGIALIG